MKFTHDVVNTATAAMSSTKPAVELEVDSRPVYFIGPATRENPLSQIRTKLFGNVYFNDPKIKWNRITLHFVGRAGLNIDAPNHSLPREVIQQHEFDLQEAASYSSSDTTHLETTIKLCDVEKELIFTNEKVIDFGLHLPPFLPPSIQAKHAFVEYTLSVTCTAATSTNFMISKKNKKTMVVKTTPVTICRHYLPSPSSMIPSIEFHGVREWFEWSAEVPQATPVEAGEVVIAFRWSVEKELVEVDHIEFQLEELETYRFSTKSGVPHSLPPIVTQFPCSLYHPPNFSNSSETHFIRTPLLLNTNNSNKRCLRTHHYDPFLEIAHRLRLVVHFTASHIRTTPLELTFPIMITDFPSNTTSNTTGYSVQRNEISPSSPSMLAISAASSSSSAGARTVSTVNNSNTNAGIIQPGGDEASCVDLDLPEYTPRYEDIIPSTASSSTD